MELWEWSGWLRGTGAVHIGVTTGHFHAKNADFDKILKIRKRTALKNDADSIDQFFKSMLKSLL